MEVVRKLDDVELDLFAQAVNRREEAIADLRKAERALERLREDLLDIPPDCELEDLPDGGVGIVRKENGGSPEYGD